MENCTKKFIDEYGTVRYFNSKADYHRTDGPSVEYLDGTKEWYLFNKGYFKTEHNTLVLFYVLEPRRMDLCPIKED